MTWQFDEEKMNVEITLMNELQSMKILRLTNKEMWLRRTETEDGATTNYCYENGKRKGIFIKHFVQIRKFFSTIFQIHIVKTIFIVFVINHLFL
jgi:hypothetical protein